MQKLGRLFEVKGVHKKPASTGQMDPKLGNSVFESIRINPK